MTEALDRLRRVCSAAGIDPSGTPRQAVSWSNDAWLLDDRRLGEVVLRIGWRGDVGRIRREAAVAEALPPGVRGPTVLGAGRTAVGDLPLAWSLTRRLRGERLDVAWASLSEDARRSAIAQLAERLRALHRWRPPPALVATVRERAGLEPGPGHDAVGADLNPLPVERALALVPRALAVSGVDAGLLDAAVAAIEGLRPLEPRVDDPAVGGLVHGDLNLSNLWLSDAGVLTMLDFEWVRLAPPVLDLQRLCDGADDDVLAGRDVHPAVLRWLAAGYPEPFQDGGLVSRLRLLSLTFAIRHLVTSPAERPAIVRRLRRLADGRWPAPGSLPA